MREGEPAAHWVIVAVDEDEVAIAFLSDRACNAFGERKYSDWHLGNILDQGEDVRDGRIESDTETLAR
jgi:hypothetical protein